MDFEMAGTVVWDEENFIPKENWHKGKKWRDAKRTRREMYWIDQTTSRPPHEKTSGITATGVPYFDNYKIEKGVYVFLRRVYRVEGFNRWRGRWRGNGRKNNAYDMYPKRSRMNKSSREWMRLRQKWADEASEASEALTV